MTVSATLLGTLLHGVAASRPAANAVAGGTVYSATDTGAISQSDGSSWSTWATISAGIADQGAFTFLDGTVAAAPATPAAGKLRLYAKTGKLLAVKDDAGVETVFGAGGSSAGTSFPGSPATNDRYYRTDLRLEAFWDGTRWLSTTLFRQTVGAGDQLQPYGTGPVALGRMQIGNGGTNNYWMEKVYLSVYNTGTVNGTNYWTYSAEIAGVSVGTTTSAADTTVTWTNHAITVNALAGTGSRDLDILCTKTLSPGSTYVLGTVEYRIVLT